MKTLHTIYMNFAKRFAIVLFFLTTLGLSSAWAVTGTLNTINSQTGTDSQGNTWTVNVVGTNSFTSHGSYFQIGNSSTPATNITLTMTLPEEQLITSFNAAFSGYSGATGTVTLKVGSTTVGTGAITASHTTSSPITISSTQQKAGTVLTVTVTGIMNGGINFHNLSYTYVSTTTHQVTWVSADATQNLDISQGMLDVNQMPNDPENCSNGAVFVGWTEQSTVTGERPTDLFNRNTLNDLPNISGPTTFTAVYAIQTEEPGPKTDVLDKATTGYPTSYKNWTASSATSSAAYAGNSSGGNSYIQLRDNTSSGIVTTTSGGKAKKITVSWHSDTKSGRVLNVYGKNTKYESSADLYDDSKKGVLLGTIVYGTSTELTISDDYKYIGLCSNNGAMYLTSVSIEWYFEGSYTDYTTSCSTDITVTLVPNGGTGDFSDWSLDGNSNYFQTIEKGAFVTLPTLNDQIAYTFGGWYDENDNYIANGGANYTPEADITLYAHWTIKPLKDYRTLCTYGILLDKNNTDAGSVDGSATVTSTYTLLENITAPTRTGYTIEGYYAEEECSTKVAGVDGTLQSGVAGYTDADGKWIAEDIQVLYTKWTANQYTITFDQQGGQGGTESVEATYGNKLPDITVPTREGYSFGGYFTEADGAGTQYYNIEGTAYRNKIWNETAPRTLYAKWTAHTYVVKFNANGGSGVMDDQTFTYDQAQPLSANAFTRTGYTFTKWNDKANGTGTSYADKQSVINLTSTKGGQKTIYAQWTANTNTPYIVEHYQEALDGSYTLVETDELTGTTDAEVTPGTKTYEGFTSPDPQTVKIAAAGSLVVQYQYTRNSYQLTWDLNGGDITAAGTAAGNVLYGAELKAPQVAKVDNVFMGWEPTVPTTMPASDATYVAQWIELTNFRTLCEYTVTWKLNGGNVGGNTDDIVHTYTNGQVIQKPTDPTRDGHHFLGWDPEFVEGTMQGNSLEYTAQWKALIPTSLQWSEDYYTATMEADNDFPDLTILPNDFAGVLTYQSSNPAVATIAADGTITLIGTGTTTITASIAADDTYLAASDSYELTVVESNCKWVEVEIEDIDENDQVVIAMTKTDGTKTWALDNSVTSTYPAAGALLVEGNKISQPLDKYIWNIVATPEGYVLYSYADKTTWLYCTGSNNTVKVGTGYDKKFVIENGYLKCSNQLTVSGQLVDAYIGVSSSTNSWRHYQNTTGVIAGQTLKFYKRECLDSEHYWLTWDAGDGQFADGSTQIVKDYAVGTTINKPFDPTRAGYDFVGWSTDGVNVVTPAENMPNENLTYIAVWKIKSYTVTWDANGGQFANSETVIEQTYEYGATITKPADPTRTGYTFTGWAPNVPTNMSTENLNFKAQWQVNQYTVTWNPGEGGHWGDSFAPIVENYNYGDPINKPTNPEKAGYVFDKWEPDVVATMPNNNLIYTAKWNEAFCDAYTFHTGNANVWNDPQEQICFEYKANHEWQIINYVIPISDAQSHFLVADKGWPQRDQGSLGGHSKSVTSTWSATMYLAPSMDSNDGNGSPKVGHAKGAVGTLRIFDDSNWDNLYVGFIPNGYKLKFGANEYDFEHYEDAEYRSEIVEYNATTANNNVSVGIINTSKAYVKTDHTQEGMRHIFVRDNIGWMNDGAKVAIYYWKGDKNGWSGFLTKVPGETNLYVGLIPVDYTSVKLIRYKDTYAGAPGSWNENDRWNETGDLTISTTQQLLTFSNWNNNPTASTYKHKGKFRIYNNSWDKNWYVHFYPHYVITFDKNAADATGTMQPQALPLDANPMTIVLNECAFKRRGYDFTGWKTDVAITADGNSVDANVKVKDKATISNINKDITLKAQWEAQAYTITYKDQGDVAYSGENSARLPQTHTYDQMTTLVAGVKTGYTFGGWYLTPECDGTAVTELGAQDYTADITLYAKWTFAMEYNITNTETIFITSAKGQTVKAATQLTLAVSNMPDGTTIALSAPNIKFYFGDEEIKQLTNKYVSETFSLTIAYTPTADNTTERPTITLSVLGNEKTFDGLISARSLPATFAIVAKVGNIWYALPSQGLNATDDLMGYPVEVDNQDDPRVVTSVPANADWSLRQVYAGQNANATKDRFKQFGYNLVFVNSAVKALNASSTGSHVLTDAQYTNYYDQYPGRYEWTPTTTDLETYQLTNAERTDRKLSIDILTRFGVYAGEITNMRFLPIQNRYTPAALQVVEWKENSVVVMYTGDPSQTATLTIDGTTQIGNANLNDNDVKKDVAIYKLPANGIANKATQRLCITIGTSKKWLTIPYIINGSQTAADVLTSTSTTKAVAAVTDVVVLDGATFTAAGNKNDKYTFRTIHVYGGGKLVVPASATEGLGIYSLILRSGTVENGTYTNSYPQLVMNGKYSNTSGIYLDYITTYERYYALSVPYPVKTKNIKYPADIYGDNLKSGNKASFALQYYDGAARATGATGWKDFDEKVAEPTLTPYQGYTFWGAPRKVSVNGGTAQRPKFGIHRIQLTGVGADDLLKSENEDKTIDITAHSADRPNDMGWNFLGNPYLAQYGGLSTSDEDVQVGLLEHEMVDGKWTGGWKHTGNLRYVTTTTDGQNYTAVEVDKATFSPFNTFFIQAATSGQLQFAWASRAQSLPARQYAAQQEAAKEITTGILLTGNDQTDRTGLLIADNFTEEYEFNADLSKFENSGINLYTIGKTGNLAYMAINQALAEQPIPVGYTAPAEGLYTIAFDEDRYNATDISALYLIDYDSNEKTNLLHTDYSFVTAAGTNNQRFALQVAFAPENATNVEWVGDATVHVGVEGNTLMLNNLPTDADVHIFDALGRLMYHAPTVPTEMQLTLPTGYYLVRIADKQHAVVIKTVIP